MSYEPFVLPQTNQTLHSSAVYRTTIRADAWADQIQSIITTAPHLGRFCPVDIWIHGDSCGYSISAKPLISIGWTYTTAAQYNDLVATSTAVPDTANRFLHLTTIGSVATPVQPVPGNLPIVARIGTFAGSTTTGAAYTQPAIGSTVLVSLSPTSTFPIVGGTIYVGAPGAAYDIYTCTAVTGAAPYVSITLQLVTANVVAPGGTVPSGRRIGAAATYSLFVHGVHRRARW